MGESLEQEIFELRSVINSERDPEGRAFVPLADAYRRAHDLDAALETLEEGLSRHPALASAHVVAAWIHQDRGDREKAVAAFERVLELDDENVRALWGLGILHLESGRPEDARAFLQRARALDPDDAEIQTRLVGLAPEGAESQAPWSEKEKEPPITGQNAPEDFEAEGEATPSSGEESHSEETARAADEVDLLQPGEPPVRPKPEDPLTAAPSDADAHEAVSGDWSEQEPPELPATRTMAEVFERQGLTDRAIEIYERLLAERPEDQEVASRLQQLRGKGPAAAEGETTESEGGEETETLALEMSQSGGHHDALSTPFAWAEETARGEEGGEPIGDYFRGLLAWEPDQEEDASPTSADEPASEATAGREAVSIEGVVPDTVEVGAAATAELEDALATDEVVEAEESVWDEEATQVEEADWEEETGAVDAVDAPPIPSPEPDTVEVEAAVPPEVAPEAVAEVEEEVPPAAVSIESLAPDVVASVDSLAPEAVAEVEEEVPPAAVSIESLAPDVVASVDSLAPEAVAEVEEEVPPAAVSIESLAPDVVASVDSLAPEAVAEVEEEVLPAAVSIESLAPDVVASVDSLAPEPVVEVEDEVLPAAVSIESLAPDVVEPVDSLASEPVVEVEEEILPAAAVSIESLAPDVVASVDSLAPEPVVEVEEEVLPAAVSIESLAPDVVASVDSLAPEPVAGVEELVLGIVPISALAPDSVVPIDLLAPDQIVSIESLAPGGAAGVR